MERMGLHTEEGNHDDQTFREAAQHISNQQQRLVAADFNSFKDAKLQIWSGV